MKNFLALLVVLAAPLVVLAGEITMSGTGSVSLAADTAYVSLSVVTEAVKPADALAMNSEATNRVFTSLDKLGVKKNEIRTNGLRLSPKYVYQDKQEPRLTGYTVTHNLKIVVCDIASTGKVLDTVVKDGANRIDNVNFDISEGKKLDALNVARKQAAKAAVDKADLYCTVLGVEKGDLKTLSEHSESPSQRNYYAADRAAASPGTNVEGGEIQMKVVVTIVWETK